MAFTLPKLMYAYDALEPHIDATTMEIHHTKHHNAYVTNLNKALEGHDVGDRGIDDLICSIPSLPEEIRTAVRNHGGGHANHALFWTLLSSHGGGEPSGALAAALGETFGDFDGFRAQFTQAALGRFGSGWAWLSLDTQRNLVVESTANQDSPLMHGNVPILGIDVWEHAYYLKYQNRRPDYVQAFYEVIDWEAVGQRYEDAKEGAAVAHSA